MRLLCIDGGGIKGLIAAQIIYRIEKEFHIKVYNYFDMFSGTSAGSMIVAAIVYGMASGNDLITNLLPNYKAKEIMNQTWKDRLFGSIQTKPKYTGIEKRRLINQTTAGKKLKNTNKRVIIPCYNINMKRTHFFKSWDPYDGNLQVVDIVDASSAAPSYYPSVRIPCNDGRSYCYVDGAISSNNPTDSAYADMLELIEKEGYQNEKIQILSLGTGLAKVKNSDLNRNVRNWGGIQWVTEGDLFELLLKGPEAIVDYRTQRFTKSLGHEYLRIQGELENSSIDDTSDENLSYLRKTGDEWFEAHKEALQKFFNVVRFG